MYRAGILTATKQFGRRRVERMLPSEHHIITECDVDYAVEYLVEGPSLPAVNHDMPEKIELLGKLHQSDLEIVVTASWMHEPDMSWNVGSWPDMNAFNRDMELLQG